MFFSHFCYILIFNYKQQGSGLSSQSCLYFQGCWGSKFNGSLVVWPSTLCLQRIQQFQDSKSTSIISDFKIFRKIFLRQLNFGVLSVWQLFYVYCKEKLHFSLTCSFLLLLSERGWALKVAYQFAMRALVAYKLVAYKKTKCSKSIPGFSISRLANVEDLLNVNIFFKMQICENKRLFI